MRFRRVFLAPAVALGVVLGANADDKNAAGWDVLRFGMTPTESVEALGARARVVTPPVAAPQRAFGLDKTIDIPGALNFAQESLREGEAGENPDREELRLAAKKLVGALKPRPWLYKTPETPGSAGKRISGVLESVYSLGDRSTDTYVRGFNIRSGNKEPVPIPESRLDAKSKEYVESIEAIIDDMARAKQLIDEKEAIRRRGGVVNPAPEILPDHIKVEPINVRGVQLNPSLKFVDGKLVEVYLATPGSDNPLTPPNANRFDVHQTLCDALEKKYGKPTEINQLDDRKVVVWRLPKMVIECTCHRLGIWIVYCTPDMAADSGEDRL